MTTATDSDLTYYEWRDGQDVEVRIPRHPFTAEHNLYSFEWDELGSPRCPWCFETFTAGDTNLGDVLDWALGHKCGDDPMDTYREGLAMVVARDWNEKATAAGWPPSEEVPV